MQFSLVRAWQSLKKFSNMDLNAEFQNIRQWLSNYNYGLIPWDRISIAGGSNGAMGIATLVSGTIVVSSSVVAANSRIFLTPQNASGTAGSVSISARTAGTSFTILSTSGSDTRDIAWLILIPG